MSSVCVQWENVTYNEVCLTKCYHSNTNTVYMIIFEDVNFVNFVVSLLSTKL